jgi:hypothetical protein
MAANDYCTHADIEAANPDVTWGTTYDALGALLATRASRLIDRHAKVEPGFFSVSEDTTRWFAGTGGSSLWIGRLAAAPTTVSVALTGVVDGPAGTGGTYTAYAATDYQLWPANALLVGEPYQRIDAAGSTYTTWVAGEKTVKIVGKFGWSTTTPTEVLQAAVIQATRWLQRGRQAYQDTGAVIELGQLTYTKALDPDVVVILDSFMDRLKPRKGSQ